MSRTVGETRFVSISEAKSILPKLVEDATPTVLLRHNLPVAAVVSIERFNDLIALERLFRNPALLDRLRAAAKKARKTPVEALRTLESLEAKTTAAATGGSGKAHPTPPRPSRARGARAKPPVAPRLARPRRGASTS